MYPKIHYIHTHKWVGNTFITVGIALIITCMFCGYEAIKSTYSWPLWKNVVYYAFVRLAYAIGVMLIFMTIFFGQFNVGMKSLRNSYFRAFGKLTFEAALITPIIIVLLYCGQDYALYLTIPLGIAFGTGNILSVLGASLLIYLCIEHPLRRIG